MNAQQWLEKNSGNCDRFGARISKAVCKEHRQNNPERCNGCPGLRFAAIDMGGQDETVLTLAFRGQDADVMRRFIKISEQDKHDPAQDLATIIELFLDGRMAVK